MLAARDYELRLLRCGMTMSGSDDDDALAAAIESGNYREALRAALKEAAVDDYDYGNDEFLARIDSFLASSSSSHHNIHVVMCAAVAAFLAFIHSNITGPPPLHQNPPPWAAHHFISSSGSDLLANFSHLQYLVLAKTLLFKIRDMARPAFPTVSWWLARVILVQQRLLDHRSSSLFDLLQLLTRESLCHFGTLDALTAYWGPTTLCRDEALAILSLLHLEAGIMEYTFGHVDSCRSHFEAAEAAAGLELSITGVLGFRTIHQVEPKAQMVLVVANNRNLSDSDGRNGNSDPDKHDSNGYVQKSYPPERLRPSEESDILITPKLVEEDSRGRGTDEEGKDGIRVGNKTATIPLSAIQQAVILAKCLLIEKTSPHDDTQRWDMAPYIEAIDSQHSSCFMIRSFCDLLRIRWESNRSHTKERSLLMMEKLVQGMYDPSPGVQHRILFCHAVCIPPLALLRKEYGELLVRCGLIGEAAKIFEDLEMWDNLILCYRLMEKKAAAVKLIKDRLSVISDDPRLWCSLGDVTNDDTCYEKALQVSNNRSARAKRSLARSAYDRGDYEASKALWESAMAMNSLYPDGWFALGAAALKAKDVDKAIDGFTRAVQLDPDNGEAWNNIACLHMIRKKNKESFIAFKEALKFKRNSWQLWENFGQVALQVRNISQALEAVRMVLELTSNKRVDTELLASIMTELETRVSNDTIRESCDAESRETKHLVDFLGKVIQLAVRSGKGGDVWGVYARWHRLRGDLTMCSEALLKQVRSYQGLNLWQDRELFRRFTCVSLELCNVYMEISSSNRRELFTAEMHLKSAIKQAAEAAFSDMEEVDHLQACLEQVQTKLQSS